VALCALFSTGCSRVMREQPFPQRAADSLGIDGLRRLFSIGDTTLSLDLTRSQIQRHAPELRLTELGANHQIWQIPQSPGRPVEFGVAFHWDSGSHFSRAVSSVAKPVLVSFDALNIAQDSLADLLDRLQPILRSLGTPTECARDTSIARRARGAPKDRAIWRRNGAETYWAVGGLPETAAELAAGRLRKASIQLYSYRTSDELMSSGYTNSVGRHDEGCFQRR
jgi:hypothetical protein